MLVISRADGSVKEFETEPCMIYHHINAHELDDATKITFSSVCLDEKFTMEFDHKIGLSNASVAPGRVWDYVIDLVKGTCGT